MSTVVTVSETYDLSTKPNKMSLIAIKTPSNRIISKTYPGLAVNHRFFKLLKCDVKLACASILPADPLQVGVSAGQIAPQDMFNPILYKAITSEGLSVLEYRLYGLGMGAYASTDGTLVGESVISNNGNVVGPVDNFDAYYGLLSNRDGFKIAHPQTGLSMKGLVPLVHEKLYEFGNQSSSDTTERADTFDALVSDSTGSALSPTSGIINYAIKGKARPLPRMNTTALGIESTTNWGIADQAGDVTWENAMPRIPNCYVACIVMPPSKLNVLYFRLVVRWYIEFSDPRPISDIQAFSKLAATGQHFYATDYSFSKDEKDEDVSLDLVEGRDADITKVMEGK